MRGIGVILHKLDSYFITSALKGIGQIAGEAGYDLVVTNSCENPEREAANARMLFDSGVDGVIASLVGIPHVLFSRVGEADDYDRVMIDNAECSRLATEHLIRQGCKRIMIIEEEDKQAGGTTAERVIQMKQRPDGLFIRNDLAAAMCVNALMDAGIRVPEDIAVVGFNNDPIGRLITPTLTTIDYSGYEMGRMAASMLVERLTGRRAGAGNKRLISSGLIVRQSSYRGLSDDEIGADDDGFYLKDITYSP
jgi:LacI family transcriptional regulator